MSGNFFFLAMDCSHRDPSCSAGLGSGGRKRRTQASSGFCRDDDGRGYDDGTDDGTKSVSRCDMRLRLSSTSRSRSVP